MTAIGYPGKRLSRFLGAHQHSPWFVIEHCESIEYSIMPSTTEDNPKSSTFESGFFSLDEELGFVLERNKVNSSG